MKKLILGIGLLGIVMGTIFSISQGGKLKASDEPASNEPIKGVQSSVASSPAIENNEQPPAETSSLESEQAVLQQSENGPAQKIPEESVPVEIPTEGNTGTTSEQTTQGSSLSESESTTIPSSTSDSVDSTTQTESETSSTTTSTTQSTSESSTVPESSVNSENPGLTTETTTVPEPPKQTTDSESPTVSEEVTPPTAVTPETKTSVAETPIVEYPEQPSVPAYEPAIPTMGTSGPLSDREVELGDELKVREIAESDFNGYELPLLSTFSDKTQGILVYEGLRQLGEKATDYSTETLVNTLFQQLFDQSIKSSSIKDIQEKELQPGDILLQKSQIIGLYLGEDYYLTVKEKQEKKMEDEQEKEKQEEDEVSEESKKKEVVVARLSDQQEKESLTGQRQTGLTNTAYASEVERAYPASFAITSNDQTKKFVDQIGKDAQKLGLKYDVFASVMIAQAILESGSGTSGLSVAPNYNLFGVKGSYEGQSVSMSTQEDRGNGDLYTISAAFRRYPSYAESLGDYVTLIRGGISGNEGYYQETWRSEAKNYLRAANSLTGKYATDTSYHRKISSIIAVYHLTQYDEKLPETTETADGQTTSGIFLQGKETIPEAYRKAMSLPDYDGKNYNTSGSYPVGQCTWYAFNRVAQLGGRVDDFMGNGGEWGAKGRRLGYEVTQTPKVGYVISFAPGTAGSDPRYGHVAIVEAITDEGILISEGNVVGGTIISYRIIPNELAKSNKVSYIKPK